MNPPDSTQESQPQDQLQPEQPSSTQEWVDALNTASLQSRLKELAQITE